jgi:hypothetical protein
MYDAKHFKQDRVTVMHGFGIRLTFGQDGIKASHVSMLIDRTICRPYGRLARANGQ